MADDKAIKVILLGESGVGKTNLIRVSIGKEFEVNTNSTLSSSYCEAQIKVDKNYYLYYLWDTAGQEKYRSLNQLFIKDSKIILIVFAINNRESFEQVGFWYQYAKDILGEGGYMVALVGNKSDLYEEDNVVKDEEIEKKAQELKIPCKVTSAASDSAGFKAFLSQLLEKYIREYHPEEYRGPTSFQIGPSDAKKNGEKGKKKCC